MHIPNYQIHNILKDFTRQLERWRHQKATAAYQGDPLRGHVSCQSGLRLTAVVNEVAGKIMKRIASLEQEAGVRETDETTQWPSVPNEAIKPKPVVFDYIRWDPKLGKVKQRLAIKDSRQLAQRFQSLTAAGEENGRDVS